MKKLLFLFLLISFYTFSQTNNQKFLEGIVYNDNSYSIQGVHVFNITSNEATITDSDGNFKSGNYSLVIEYLKKNFKRLNY